jgi:hypothetical protein
MPDILKTIPDGKGGQLKFRVNSMLGWGNTPEYEFQSGPLTISIGS